MPRPARFDQEAILAATLRVVAAHGPKRVTIDAVAAEMGGHVGSIYYRFPTKDHLMAQLWMRCARSGHAGMTAALRAGDLDEALDRAVLHYPRWSREDLAAAQVLAAYGREQITPDSPDELGAELATINDDLIDAVADFTARWFTRDGTQVSSIQRRVMTFVLLDLPSSAIRRYLIAGKPPPRSLDPAIRAAARAALREAGPPGTST
jgi:AcrR family transcriptional regulator